eukprot:CAMPEP_0197610658 /NCGR_PEP_ID=MMETSP1326-20131121/53815_1 /TAXON_ID=1155430 /ORGANISM="Genus nov. species nov., Strain RCC2288" /LENGTH=84 /DNA_ID=CAMNT_0043179199 /DNA_START=187 /DNA_END=438 /DNA_ORIENTATION=-
MSKVVAEFIISTRPEELSGTTSPWRALGLGPSFAAAAAAKTACVVVVRVDFTVEAEEEETEEEERGLARRRRDSWDSKRQGAAK